MHCYNRVNTVQPITVIMTGNYSVFKHTVSLSTRVLAGGQQIYCVWPISTAEIGIAFLFVLEMLGGEHKFTDIKHASNPSTLHARTNTHTHTPVISTFNKGENCKTVLRTLATQA